MHPFRSDIDFQSGAMSRGVLRTRRVSDMLDYFADKGAAREAAEDRDPLVYQYTTIDLPEESGHVLHGMTTIYPGLVGREYYMTKGHYHRERAAGEVYLCLSGLGKLVMEREDGETAVLDMEPGTACYVPPYWAHRACNVGEKPLVFFASFPGHAGHDYGTVEQYGFANRVENHGGKTVVIDPMPEGRGL